MTAMSGDSKSTLSISILWGYSWLIGLHYKGFIWDIPILIFALCVFGALMNADEVKEAPEAVRRLSQCIPSSPSQHKVMR